MSETYGPPNFLFFPKKIKSWLFEMRIHFSNVRLWIWGECRYMNVSWRDLFHKTSQHMMEKVGVVAGSQHCWIGMMETWIIDNSLGNKLSFNLYSLSLSARIRKSWNVKMLRENSNSTSNIKEKSCHQQRRRSFRSSFLRRYFMHELVCRSFSSFLFVSLND